MTNLRKKAKKHQLENLMSQDDAWKFVKDFHGRFDEPFYLLFGTLLGYYRENRFIPWDIDIDFGFEDGRQEEVLHACKNLTLTRYTKNLLTYTQDNISIDCYFFEKRCLGYFCKGEGYEYRMSNSEFTNIQEIYFGGLKFLAPVDIEDYLRKRYGYEWRIPRMRQHAKR